MLRIPNRQNPLPPLYCTEFSVQKNSYPCTVTNKVPFYGNLPIKREKSRLFRQLFRILSGVYSIFMYCGPPSIPRPYTVRSAGQVPHCIGRSDRRTPFHQYFRSIVFSPPDLIYQFFPALHISLLPSLDEKPFSCCKIRDHKRDGRQHNRQCLGYRDLGTRYQERIRSQSFNPRSSEFHTRSDRYKAFPL